MSSWEITGVVCVGVFLAIIAVAWVVTRSMDKAAERETDAEWAAICEELRARKQPELPEGAVWKQPEVTPEEAVDAFIEHLKDDTDSWLAVHVP